ncbi:MAG: ATP-binding cassette domain-containing protein [Chloroflexi bacterium]|nr:ATP-binding cassette domain-containing protein [Chloroflexota bacterium]
MIAVEQMDFAYPGATAVFQGFSWNVARGEAWAVLGPSGCGKSTLLSILAGLLAPQKGRVGVDGQPLTRPRPQTGLIIQDYGLLPWATIRENARLGLRIRNLYGPDGVHAPRDYVRTLNVDAWLERLGLLPYADQYPGHVSGGQRQRTAIARTLALQPDLLLMDEPFSSLDAPTRESLQSLALELWKEAGLTLVIVTHAIEEAAVLGQKILLLGRPPNQAAQIIDNPGVTQPAYRDSVAYTALCKDLRGRLEQS